MDALELLQQDEHKDLLRFITAGSVDDGKSTLIGRLLYEANGIYEDQLSAVERASGRLGSSQGELDLALSQAERKQAVHTILKLNRSGLLPVLNSSASLKRMVDNTWKCRSWILANVDPDGSLWTGCYLQKRGEIRCRYCGFTPVAEASLAVTLHPGALYAGWRIFLRK